MSFKIQVRDLSGWPGGGQPLVGVSVNCIQTDEAFQEHESDAITDGNGYATFSGFEPANQNESQWAWISISQGGVKLFGCFVQLTKVNNVLCQPDRLFVKMPTVAPINPPVVV